MKKKAFSQKLETSGLTQSHFCACLKRGLGIPSTDDMVFLCSLVIVRFVDISGIVDCHCLSFLSP
jgi:hypothetical protein